MKKSTTVILIIVGLLVGGGLILYFINRKKRAAQNILNASGAIDAADEATVQQMVQTMAASPFKDSLPYIADILPLYQSGKAGVMDGYSKINGAIPKSAAFNAALWNGWAGSVLANSANEEHVHPAYGRTQTEAENAKKLLRTIAKQWENYKFSKSLQSF